jgi:hypothetical protein
VTERPATEIPAWASLTGFDGLAPILPGGRQAPRPPKAAVELVEHAIAAGWKTALEWAEDSEGEPFLSVHLAIAEPYHYFRLCWHSRGQLPRVDPEQEPTRDVSGARLRLFSKSLTTRGAGAPAAEAPSVKAIRQTIAAHPATAATATPTTEGGTP